ncbi:hypothetical protein [Collinsella bouchesdurhonensis]|uniref:hypothetical protein n=1 Tax=Collinsella bouchesdurhonensis TaxID=1907654 RepID=UPI003563028B
MMCVFVAALTVMLAACSNATTASSATEGSDVRYDVEHVQKSLEALEAQRSQKSGATAGRYRCCRRERGRALAVYWPAQNGSGDLLFDAIAVDGVVMNVSKYNLAKNYWCDAAGTMRVLPDRTASGARVDGGATQFIPNKDPSDYDSPDEYADAAEDEFAAHGSSNSWQEAFDYWESCMG